MLFVKSEMNKKNRVLQFHSPDNETKKTICEAHTHANVNPLLLYSFLPFLSFTWHEHRF